MLRFYLIATALVVGGLVLILSFERAGRPLEVAAVQSTGSPSAARAQGRSTLVPIEVNGNAPWAMSALPECFRQVLSARGKAAFVRSQLPAGGVETGTYVALRSADCSLSILPGRAIVRREKQRLVIPPTTRFYRWPDRIGFVRQDATGAELRVYRLSAGGPVVLTPFDGP